MSFHVSFLLLSDLARRSAPPASVRDKDALFFDKRPNFPRRRVQNGDGGRVSRITTDVPEAEVAAVRRPAERFPQAERAVSSDRPCQLAHAPVDGLQVQNSAGDVSERIFA